MFVANVLTIIKFPSGVILPVQSTMNLAINKYLEEKKMLDKNTNKHSNKQRYKKRQLTYIVDF